MKYFYILSLLLTLAQAVLPMKTTFLGPTAHVEKPRFARLNLTTTEGSIACSHATIAYNRNGQKVPLLAYRGVEPLLPQFLDNSVPLSTATPLSYALFDATYQDMTYNFSWVQNLHESLYFELSSCIARDKLKNITMIPTKASGKFLTPQEIDSIPTLTPYLSNLQQQVGTDQQRNYIGPSYFLFGYTASLTDFNYFDFIDISLQTGCMVPTIALDNNYQYKFSVFPRQDMTNLGIPLQLTVALGLYDWLNVGASGSVTGYIKNDQIIALNTAAAPNKLLIPQSGLCCVYHEPRIAFSAYIEGEYFLPNWTWFVGISYTKQNPTQYQAHDLQKFPSAIINHFPAQQQWQQTCLTFASEFDLTYNPSNLMPRCKLMYTKPLYGKTCFASSLFAGQFGLEVTYNF